MLDYQTTIIGGPFVYGAGVQKRGKLDLGEASELPATNVLPSSGHSGKYMEHHDNMIIQVLNWGQLYFQTSVPSIFIINHTAYYIYIHIIYMTICQK